MTLQDLRTLLDYHYWARDRLLEAVAPLTADQLTRDLGGSFKSIRDTLNHLYAAEWAWYSRWQGQSPAGPLPVDLFADVESLRAGWAALEGDVRVFVNRLGDADVERVFEYRALSGQPGSSPFWQMLQHLVNHGSYHRGQVTNMLRQIGVAPPKSMDLIAFYRLAASTPQR